MLFLVPFCRAVPVQLPFLCMYAHVAFTYMRYTWTHHLGTTAFESAPGLSPSLRTNVRTMEPRWLAYLQLLALPQGPFYFLL